MDVCILCKSFKKDDIQYGEFLENKDFGVHTFCLYLSSNLEQNGHDDEGFLGFLPNDIKAEVKRISLLKCCYCYKKYANIGCCERKCRNTFHLICGIENGVENRFCKDYRSYCHKHSRMVSERPSPTETCLICFDRLCAPGEVFNKIEMIMTPCCQNGWFHKLCLQKFAKTAGYFFKCPLCNDDKVFREELPAKGIFIPNQDAAWELEPNAFADLLERPNKCAADRCKNKKGRKAKSENNPFVMCQTCGSTAIHKLCLPNGGNNFNCADCSVALEERDSGRESLNSYANQNDEYVDVCHVSDKEDLEIVNRIFGATDGTRTEHKRDSGTHNDTDISDEETLHAAKKYRQIKNGDDDDDDVIIKPSTSKRSLCLRLASESPETVEEIKSSCTKTRFINETKKSCSKKKLELVVKRKSPDVFTESDDDDSELDNVNTSQSIVEVGNSDSSDQEEIRISNRKRKQSIISTDSDDEIPSPKQQCLINFTDESDDDSDPLENFDKIMEKAKNSFIPKRTVTLSAKKQSADRKFVDWQKKNTISKAESNIRGANSNKPDEKKQTQNENLLNYSCIALRTRRKTICGRTDFDKQTEYENSQVYEKIHGSNETLELLTDEDERSEISTESDINNFIADDGYEERDSKFEISCIANRTRRRKSLKMCNRLPKIVEISDCNSESSKSPESLCKIRNFGRLRNRRIYSSSSEELDTEPSTLPKAKLLKLEKYSFHSTPQTNNKKTESYNSNYFFRYQPFNAHHPHNSNRNRI